MKHAVATIIMIICACGLKVGHAAQVVGAISIPTDSYPTELITDGQRLFVGLDSVHSSLSCYSISSAAVVWDVEYDMRGPRVVPPKSLVLTSGRLFGNAGSVPRIRVHDAATGTLTATLPIARELWDLGTITVGPKQLVYGSTIEEVYFIDPSTAEVLLTVDLPDGGDAGVPGYLPASKTLLVPLNAHHMLEAVRLNWNSGANELELLSQTQVITNSYPGKVMPLPGFASFIVQCDGSFCWHDATTLQPTLASLSVANASDAIVSNGKYAVCSYHKPGEAGYMSGLILEDYVNSYSLGVKWFPDTYILEICDTPLTDTLYCLDRGMAGPGDMTTPGSLMCISTLNGSLLQTIPLGGMNIASCYVASSNRLYVSDPYVDAITVIQL